MSNYGVEGYGHLSTSVIFSFCGKFSPTLFKIDHKLHSGNRSLPPRHEF